MNSSLTRAEIRIDAIAHNVRELRRITQPNALLMAVVKADAYGHGAEPVAREALKHGAQWIGVARIDEAIQLRQAGLTAPILIFGYTPPERAYHLIEWELKQTVHSLHGAQMLSEQLSRLGKRLKIHLKIDTGMGRLGMMAGDTQTALIRDIESVIRLKGVEAEGIMTHFAASDSMDKSYANLQFERFSKLTETLTRYGITFPIRHAANSGAIIDMPQTHLDMVRAGISLYGLYPSDEVDKSRIQLQPAMSLKAAIIQLKDVPAGFNVSYGMTWQASHPTRIAAVCIGYADGLNRLLSSKGRMLVRGQSAPIIGRVCMDLTMLDVGHIPDVRLGDEVVIFGTQGSAEISVDEIASCLNTINYEIVSTITARVPRYYLS